MHRSIKCVLKEAYNQCFRRLLEGQESVALKPAHRQWHIKSDTIGIAQAFEVRRQNKYETGIFENRLEVRRMVFKTPLEQHIRDTKRQLDSNACQPYIAQRFRWAYGNICQDQPFFIIARAQLGQEFKS
jgi:hypothetical protein